METKLPKVAILVDAENANYSRLNHYVTEAQKFGEICIRRAYADWSNLSMKNWREPIMEHSFNTIHKFAYTKHKNSTDTKLIIDAMQILYENNLDCFVIVSSDSDFTGLAQTLREKTKKVIGIGKSNTPVCFSKSCNHFVAEELFEQEIIQNITTLTPEISTKDIRLNVVGKMDLSEIQKHETKAKINQIKQAVHGNNGFEKLVAFLKKADSKNLPKKVKGLHNIFESYYRNQEYNPTSIQERLCNLHIIRVENENVMYLK